MCIKFTNVYTLYQYYWNDGHKFSNILLNLFLKENESMLGRKIKIIMVAFIALFFITMSTTNEVSAIKSMPEGTAISGIIIAGKNEKESIAKVTSEVTNWQAGDDFIVRSEFEEYFIPRTAFQFDMNETIKDLRRSTKRTLSNLYQRPKNVDVPLYVTIDEENEVIQQLTARESYIDTNQLFRQLTQLAADLQEDVVTLPYIEGKALPLKTVTQVELASDNMSDVVLKYIIEQLNGYIIAGNDAFSFIEAVPQNTNIITTDDEIKAVASTLYEAFLYTNFQFVERHAHVYKESKGSLGLDTYINYKEKKDLIVINPNQFAYQINVELEKNGLVLIIKTLDEIERITYEVSDEEAIPFRTMYRYSKELTPGEKIVVQEGVDGGAVIVTRTVGDETEVVSEDVYMPTPQIILASTKDPEEGGSGDGASTDEDGEDIVIEDPEIEDSRLEIEELKEHLANLIIYQNMMIEAEKSEFAGKMDFFEKTFERTLQEEVIRIEAEMADKIELLQKQLDAYMESAEDDEEKEAAKALRDELSTEQDALEKDDKQKKKSKK